MRHGSWSKWYNSIMTTSPPRRDGNIAEVILLQITSWQVLLPVNILFLSTDSSACWPSRPGPARDWVTWGPRHRQVSYSDWERNRAAASFLGFWLVESYISQVTQPRAGLPLWLYRSRCRKCRIFTENVEYLQCFYSSRLKSVTLCGSSSSTAHPLKRDNKPAAHDGEVRQQCHWLDENDTDTRH